MTRPYELPSEPVELEADSDYAFVAFFDNVAFVASLLRCIHVTSTGSKPSSPPITCTPTEHGFKFIVRDVTYQATLYVQKSLCRNYKMWQSSITQTNPVINDNNPNLTDNNLAVDAVMPSQSEDKTDAEQDDLSVTVNTNVLMDCLNLYNTAFVTPQPDQNMTLEQLCSSAAMSSGGYVNANRNGTSGDRDAPHTSSAYHQPAISAVSPYYSTTLKFTCRGHGYPLELILDQSRSTSGSVNTTTRCKLTSYTDGYERDAGGSLQSPEYFDYAWNAFEEVNKVIMKSGWLRDAFSQLDSSSERVEILVSPETPSLRISSRGLTGTTEIECPKDSDVIEAFSVTQQQVYNYYYATLMQCMRALALSNKTSLRMNARGVLSLQFMIHVTRTEMSFVEFVILPLETGL